MEDLRVAHPWHKCLAEETQTIESIDESYKSAYCAGFMAAERHYHVARCIAPNGRTDGHMLYGKSDGGKDWVCSFCNCEPNKELTDEQKVKLYDAMFAQLTHAQNRATEFKMALRKIRDELTHYQDDSPPYAGDIELMVKKVLVGGDTLGVLDRRISRLTKAMRKVHGFLRVKVLSAPSRARLTKYVKAVALNLDSEEID